MDVRTTNLPELGVRLPTGGELNRLNEHARCNSRRKSVPVMDLVRAHRPADPEVLRVLIENHHHRKCRHCDCRSMGTVEQFATNLYNAQFERGAGLQKRYTWDECYNFQYTLFCVAPLRGRAMEEASMAEFVKAIKEHDGFVGLKCREATRKEDFEYAVDFVVVDSCGAPVLGVQTKPASFLHRADVLQQNRDKQARFNAPVVFHVYDRSGTFSPAAATTLTQHGPYSSTSSSAE